MDCQGCGATASVFDVHCPRCGALLVPPSAEEQCDALGWKFPDDEAMQPSPTGPKLGEVAGAVGRIGLAVGVGVVGAAAALIGAEIAGNPADIRLQNNIERGINKSRS